LIKKAVRLIGVTGKIALVRLGLLELIVRESTRQLAGLGGTDPELAAIPRGSRGTERCLPTHDD
jgi:hypothetical protein